MVDPCPGVKRRRPSFCNPSEFIEFMMEAVQQALDINLTKEIAALIESYQYGYWEKCIDCKECVDSMECEWFKYAHCRKCIEEQKQKYTFSDSDD